MKNRSHRVTTRGFRWWPPQNVELEVGKEYSTIHYHGRFISGKYKFIQTTKKGYNFLDMGKNKLVYLNRHFYPNQRDGKKLTFVFPHSSIVSVE